MPVVLTNVYRIGITGGSDGQIYEYLSFLLNTVNARFSCSYRCLYWIDLDRFAVLFTFIQPNVAMQISVIIIICRLSLSSSVKRVYCGKTAAARIMRFSLECLMTKFEGVSSIGGSK